MELEYPLTQSQGSDDVSCRGHFMNPEVLTVTLPRYKEQWLLRLQRSLALRNSVLCLLFVSRSSS
jgi:hypothetical protein